LARALFTLDITILASTPIIAITTSNSINVNPLLFILFFRDGAADFLDKLSGTLSGPYTRLFHLPFLQTKPHTPKQGLK
jgi:hypothetical protein